MQKFEQVPRRREIVIQKFDIEKRERPVDVAEYETIEGSVPLRREYQEPFAIPVPTAEKFTVRGVDSEKQMSQNVVYPEIRMVDKVVEVVVRKPQEGHGSVRRGVRTDRVRQR